MKARLRLAGDRLVNVGVDALDISSTTVVNVLDILSWPPCGCKVERINDRVDRLRDRIGDREAEAEQHYMSKLEESGTSAKPSVRTEPANLNEKLALEEAKAGAGERIMAGKVKDPKFPQTEWAKMQHVHVGPPSPEAPSGVKTVIHYWQNLINGVRTGFKFK